jgi:hypothetical protein
MHRDFGVRVLSQQLLTFDADGAVTQSCSFGGAGDDTDVLGHGGILCATGTVSDILPA